MKRFSKISGVKVNEEPKIEIPKKQLELESMKSSIMKLMDDFLIVKSYGNIRQYVPVTKIDGKELFLEALIDLISDKSFKDQIKVLESLKGEGKDWQLIDDKIEIINDKIEESNEPLSLSHVEKIKKMINLYSDNENNFDMYLEQQLSRIKDKETLLERHLTANKMIKNPKYIKLPKKYLIAISEGFLSKYKKMK